jgi:hypothetical protein
VTGASKWTSGPLIPTTRRFSLTNSPLSIDTRAPIRHPAGDMTTPPADSPAPERPLSWWRHRRRLFYLAVVGATVAALWGGWVWWYRADVSGAGPMRQCKALGME